MTDGLTDEDESYDGAVELLREAFSDVLEQKYKTISRLRDLDMSKDSDPIMYIREVRMIEKLFTKLNITVNQVIQYFVWSSLTTRMQTQFIHMSNDNNPDLEFIDSNFFKALKRCREIDKREKTRPVTLPLSSFAADVKKQSPKFCSLCKTKGEHATRDCPKFPSVQDKLTRLKSIDGCLKCGFGNHTTENCRYKFSQDCMTCKKAHMTFLCPPHGRPDAKPKTPKSVSTGVVWASQAGVGENTLLPTFRAEVHSEPIRCLKDSGCQPHFIVEELATRLSLDVIDSHDITINGFNSSQTYRSQLVRVPLFVGGTSHMVEALTVPCIRTSLSLPGLTAVAKTIRRKGYVLADPDLIDSDYIKDISFVLGMSNPEILLEEQISFGGPRPSMLAKTRAGVLLGGNLSVLRDNLADLADVGGVRSALPGLRNMTEPHPIIDEGRTSKTLQATSVAVDPRKIRDEDLQRALIEVQNYDLSEDNNTQTDCDLNLSSFVLNETVRLEDGRLQMPLIWKTDIKSKLGTNYNLARSILRGMRKLSQDKLLMIQSSIQEWVDDGVVEEVGDARRFISEHPDCSFLSHMGVFRMDRETTKCRVVFLSNLCERRGGELKVSHNQAILSGPSLNQKLTSAFSHLRFDEHLICYDLKRAFLQISLKAEDSDKLLFLWFKDVRNGDFSISAYRNLRLSFGLRCSPTILMLALYRILCEDSISDPPELREIKRKMYALIYMDNGAFTGTETEVVQFYNILDSIFNPYKFHVQQIMTDLPELQKTVDRERETVTTDSPKLLGLIWNRTTDQISCKSICLDPKANTKRTVLSSIAAQYDPLNIQGPCLNRARLFLHDLQNDSKLDWDEKISNDRIKEWHNIVKQANRMNPPQISRKFGNRSDPYEIVVFSDASKCIYAAVCYLRNLSTNEVNFLMAKHRLVSKKMKVKTIPALELQAISLGVDLILEVQNELSGDQCLFPINITKRTLFTDSSITIHWLTSQVVKFDKMQKLSIFVRNRLDYIERSCESFPITFKFVSTKENTADCLTRCLSPAMLASSRYHAGPEFLKDENHVTDLEVHLPNSSVSAEISTEISANPASCEPVMTNTLIDLSRFSQLRRAINSMAYVFQYIHILKSKTSTNPSSASSDTHRQRAWRCLVLQEQLRDFPDVVNFLTGPSRPKRDIPPLVSQLNLFLDKDGIVRVKSKFGRWQSDPNFAFPILLCHSNYLLKLVIKDLHIKFCHAGIYTVIRELKKKLYIFRAFSTVKKVVSQCITCKKIHSRNIKTNQNAYRDFRANPPNVPFQSIFLDHLGPFRVRRGSETVKAWLLLVTCLWSRAVALYVCSDVSTKEFLTALQVHILREGLPAEIYSDLGGAFVSGSQAVRDALDREPLHSYCLENNINKPEFHHYPRGNPERGSLVESCVKLVKHLFNSAVSNNVLDLSDFYLIIEQVVHIVNKRPLCFKEALRDDRSGELPVPVTPELLIRGREINSLDVIPESRSRSSRPPDLANVRNGVVKAYNDELYSQLISQATNRRLRYHPKTHVALAPGDIVLICDDKTKTFKCPLALVESVVTNSLGEVVEANLIRRYDRLRARRHVKCLKFIMRPSSSM